MTIKRLREVLNDPAHCWRDDAVITAFDPESGKFEPVSAVIGPLIRVGHAGRVYEISTSDPTD